jgi:hypothetical protein
VCKRCLVTLLLIVLVTTGGLTLVLRVGMFFNQAQATPIDGMEGMFRPAPDVVAWDLADRLIQLERESEADINNLIQGFDHLAEIKSQTELELMQENAQLRERIKKLEAEKKDCHPPSFGNQKNNPEAKGGPTWNRPKHHKIRTATGWLF